MRSRILLPVRFWGSLAVSTIPAGYAISLGSKPVVQWLASLDQWASGYSQNGLVKFAQSLGAHFIAGALSLITMIVAAATVVAIAFITWRVVYLVLGFGMSTTELTLEPFGQGSRKVERPKWADGTGDHKGTLDAFKEESEHPQGEYPTEFRIGIILAGGGAKGVYQAGALEALWEFLEENGCIKYVRMIAGTSIGSWNAMFWLADKVKDRTQRKWWTSARLATVVTPAAYVPFFRNFIATPEAWRRDYVQLFGGTNEKIGAGPPFFYFTRTDVNSAELEFTTNRISRPGRHNYRDLPTNPLPGAPKWSGTVDEKKIESAVFASMDIPPAFKRMRGLDHGEVHEYEDGGVIDNLPIQFATQYEGCNLLFVFPLNATFALKSPGFQLFNLISLRLSRVMDIRQGVLEHTALKDISLYNQIIAAGTGLSGVHTKPATTFCICPGPGLDVGTMGFWQLRRHGEACYKLMYEATKAELKKFDFSPGNQDVWMATVDSDGAIGYQNFTIGS